MQRMLVALSVTLSFAALFTACGSPAAPTPPTLADQASKSSSQSDLWLIRVEKDGGTAEAPVQKVTLGENFSKGMSASQMPPTWKKTWNGANISLVHVCNGREENQIVQYPGQGVADATWKILMPFGPAPTCAGTQVSFRLRANSLLLEDGTRTTAYTDFDLPDRNVLVLSSGFNIIREGGKSWIRGTLQ